MNRKEKVFESVQKLYNNSSIEMGRWLWNNHVQWVADKSVVLADKYGANVEKVYCSALLHDIGDSEYERGHDDFDTWSDKAISGILLQSGFSEEESEEISEIIIRPHSCRPDNLPTTIEGKVLATADAMFHIQTSFFPRLLRMNRPLSVETYEQWQDWFAGKIERDFNSKIFFKDEKREVNDDYQALCRIFNARTLSSD